MSTKIKEKVNAVYQLLIDQYIESIKELDIRCQEIYYHRKKMKITKRHLDILEYDLGIKIKAKKKWITYINVD